MTIKYIFVSVLMALFVAAGSTAVIAQSEWKDLGTETVDFNVDHDTINVNDSSMIRELRLSVKNSPVKFLRVVINYKDGTKQELEYLEDVAIGGESRVIPIGGDGHVISSVAFWYETASLGGKKSQVTLYGRSSAPMSMSNAAPISRSMASTANWKNLGDEDVGFDVDHDTIEVSDSGTFRELRLSVKHAPIRFLKVAITYKDGETKEVEYLENVEVGKESRSINIEGDGHVIKEVAFWYETASLGGKKAKVTLFGR